MIMHIQQAGYRYKQAVVLAPLRLLGADEYDMLLLETVALSTRMGDITIRTFNQTCARQFVRSVEDMLFEERKVSTS